MRARCEAFLPDMKNARLDPDYPLAQGLRSFRAANVRVERELRRPEASSAPSRIIHSYGQGGSGWTLSFGCAADVLALVEEALQDLPPAPMTMDPSHTKRVFGNRVLSDGWDVMELLDREKGRVLRPRGDGLCL
jgi:D-amino-acid oxidase